MQIANVSSQTSGLYRCSATNLLGTENCYVNLSVYSGKPRPPIPQSSLLPSPVVNVSPHPPSQLRAAPRASFRASC